MAEYYMFNKPKGCISACRDDRSPVVMDYFSSDIRENLFHVGRLDRDTEGLLIVSDDGALCNRLMMPDHKVKKTYFFWAEGEISASDKAKLEEGIDIYGNGAEITAPAELEIIKKATLLEIKDFLSEVDLKKLRRRPGLPVFSGLLTITEGKKHQVKRMLGYFGCRVVYLKRISIGELSLDENLRPGEYRPLTEEELRLLQSEE